jgi:hypothetical protein
MADRERDIRAPQPGAAAQDPDDAARQEQARRDAAEVRAEARRVEASIPPDIRDKTVGEIVDEANRRAQR